jgi:carboxypeptidase D
VATTLEQTSTDFVNFFENFENLFGLRDHKIFVTGESYAGRYVPYIASAMLDKNDTSLFNVSGALMYDPCIGDWDFTQQEVPVVPFARSNNNVMNFNASFLSDLESRHQSCGYADILSTYLTFPPPGHQPAKFFNSSAPNSTSCALWEALDHAAFTVNPCFDVYDVSAGCPLLWDVLGHRTQFDYTPQGAPEPYPNRSDVKAALHVPESTDWNLDQHFNVFVSDNGAGGPEMAGETSLDPIQYTLPRLIEATNRVLISNGDLSMIILTNGTLLAIQNMTWNDAMGFQSSPFDPYPPNASNAVIVDTPDLLYEAVFESSHQKGRDQLPQGTTGAWHYERGLMWVETFAAAHAQPESQPRASLKHLQWVLGRIDSLA